MTTRTVARLDVFVVVVTVLGLVAGTVLFVLNRSAGLAGSIFSLSDVGQTLSGSLAFLGVGALVTAKRPANAVGWLCLALGALGCLAWAAEQYAGYALLAHPGALPGGVAVVVAQEAGFAPQLVLLLLVVVLFPDGRLPTSRWRVVPVGAIVSFAALYAVGLTQKPSPPFASFRNPLEIDGSPVVAIVLFPALVVATAAVAGAFASVVVRFRRSYGDERAQLKWLMFAVAWLPVLLFAHAVADTFETGTGAVGTIELLFAVVAACIPVSIGIAILRYRLYDIDRMVSRSLSYGLITIVLVGAYVGLVLTGQALFSSFAGGSNLAIAVSTLVVAALFLPLRTRVQRVVDRRFNRRRYDVQQTLEAFGTRLREQVELDVLGQELVGTVGETMQPAHGSLWLRRPES